MAVRFNVNDDTSATRVRRSDGDNRFISSSRIGSFDKPSDHIDSHANLRISPEEAERIARRSGTKTQKKDNKVLFVVIGAVALAAITVFCFFFASSIFGDDAAGPALGIIGMVTAIFLLLALWGSKGPQSINQRIATMRSRDAKRRINQDEEEPVASNDEDMVI